MEMSKELKEITKDEWKDLGFYYDQDKEKENWRIVGSKQGILKFCSAILKYCNNPNHNQIGEHEHLGPYMYFKIITMTEPAITENGIVGTIQDLKKLVKIIEQYLSEVNIGSQFTICKEFSLQNELTIVFDVRDESFDPSILDRNLWK